MWLPLGEVGLHHAVVRRDRRAVALPPRHRLAGRATLTLADLADEPVVRPAVLTSAEAERFWLADPRPGGRPAPRGPVLPCVEDALLEVARGRGVWFAPQPLSAVIPLGGLRWVEVEDAEPFDLAVVWTDRAPQALVGRLVAEVRSVLGEGRRVRVA
ncbi:hypothetical protein GCM10017786_37680 [Amycolatopsis deserti]|uniref:LysR substrate-binding domain-containing protein n=2 Tax=Amycolatopsis deserti TaxID=185696 RepID=A0ABQ3J1Y5_9PSEU|nr:hypothetical protein GCM10017786_37680 [Amycolatopsis deserti]